MRTETIKSGMGIVQDIKTIKNKGVIMATNREKLAKMTNEELAKLLVKDSCAYCAFTGTTINCGSKGCIAGVTEWLNREREECLCQQ